MSTITLRRLFGVLAHVDAGKTTVSERLLFTSGRIHRVGEVHHGNTTLDHTAEEKKHGITITAAATTTSWKGHVLSLIDTPGHIDFAIEVERSLRVLDGAVVVLDASRGVEPQTESVWRQAERHRVPRVVFLNKLDAPGASVESCLRDLRARLRTNPVLLQTVRADGALVDLVEPQVLRFSPTGELEAEPCEAPPERAQLLEQVAEHDPALLEHWATGHPVSPSELRAALRRACISRALVPVLCGAALKNRGIQPLLDAVVHYLPSPDERPLPEGLTASATAPVLAFVFKTEVDAHVGTLAWVRVFQGTIVPGSALVLRPGSNTERVSRVLGLHGGKFEPLESLSPGGIAALVGLKSAHTGNTLCAQELAVVLEGVSAADPVVELALSTRNVEEQSRLTEALRKACFEDPSLRVRVDSETGQTVLCGVGELHLSIWLEKLARREGVSVKTGAPRVAVRDTLGGSATVTLRHVRQSGGPGQFAVVTLQVRPLARGAGVTFVDETKGGVVPQPFVAAVESGARAAMSRGVREGVPLVDVELTLLDGQVHVRDSSAVAFEVAGSLALQEAAGKAGLIRLEPMAEVVVTAPELSVGAVLGELASRRAAVQGVVVEQESATVRASMPLVKTFGFVTALRSRTEGRAEASIALAGYAPE
jgi:elongation factor G